MPRRSASDDDGELSDSARAALQIQRELEQEDNAPRQSVRRSRAERDDARGMSPHRQGRPRSDDQPLGDGRKTGALTGIKLGEHAIGARPAGPQGEGSQNFSVNMKMKGRGGKVHGPSLESLANQDEREELKGSSNMPEAPAGSYRRHDITKLEMEADVDVTKRPTAQRGIDGKVWGFIEAPSDDSDAGADQKQTKSEKKAKDKHDKKKLKKAKKKLKKLKKDNKKLKERKEKHKKKDVSSTSSDNSS